MTTTAPVRVDLDGRRFYVEFGRDGEAVRITERRICNLFGVDQAYKCSYWSAKHHAANPGSIPAKVIAAAKAKLDAAP